MNILKKITVFGLFGILAAGSIASAQANPSLTVLLPQISALTAKIGEHIAVELKSQLAQAVAAPRAQRSARAASVVITESAAVVVEATRLPSADALADAGEAHAVRVRF